MVLILVMLVAATMAVVLVNVATKVVVVVVYSCAAEGDESLIIIVKMLNSYLSYQVLLALDGFHEPGSVEVLKLLDKLLLSVPDVLNELDGCVVDPLFHCSNDLLALCQCIDLQVVLVNLGLAVLHQNLDVLLVLDDCLTELCYLVVFVFVEGAQHTDAGVTRLTVETNNLVLKHTTQLAA